MSRRGSGSLSILFELFATGQRTRQLLTEALADSEINAVEYAVYSLVNELGAASPTELAGRLAFPVTTMLDHIRDMLARGHCIKSPNPVDGRSYLVRLSAEGHHVFRRTGADFERAISRILANLNSDPELLREMLRELGLAADAALADLRLGARRAN